MTDVTQEYPRAPETEPTVPMTAIGRTERGRVPAPVSAARPGHVLPAPPRDDEKYQYVRRKAWILVVFAVASTPLLLFSQALTGRDPET